MNQATNIPMRRLRAQSSKTLTTAILLLMIFSAIPNCLAQILVPYNQTWNYNQANVDLLTAWREPTYNASGWPSGAGPMGFPVGEALLEGLSIQTVLNRFMPPPDTATQVRTYYFQTKFVFTNDPLGVTLIASNLIDDAAVFYLNGVEIGRAGFNADTVVTHASEGNRAANDVTAYGFDVFTNIPTTLIRGTNVLAVEVHQTGGASSDLVFAHRLLALIPTRVSITAQPANITIAENRIVNLTVGVIGTPAPTFQWYKDSAPITDATNQTYTIASTVLADSGNYHVVVSNPLNSVTSSSATLTVVTDATGPVLLNVKGDDTYTKVFLTWNELILLDAAEEEGSYRLLAPDATEIPISLATLVNGSNVVLTLATRLKENTVYSLEAGFQVDVAGNPTVKVGSPTVDPSSGIVMSFRSFVITPGFTRFDAYLGRPSGESIATFVATPDYRGSPTFSFFTNSLNWPQSIPNFEQYKMRFSGYFVAPETGMHHFNPAHDDEMRLRVYPGEDFTDTPFELAAGCCTSLTVGPTLDVDLVAGQRYYFELIVAEFGGADYAGIAVTMPSGAVSSPIESQFMAAAAFTQGASVTITQQPVSKVFSGAVTAFLLDFNSNDGGFAVEAPQGEAYSGPWHYQASTGSWREDGQGPETGHPNTSLLNSLPLVVRSSGNVVLTFAHRYSRESGFWDGGQVRISANDGPVTVVPNAAFSQNGYNGTVLGNSSAVIAGQEAFVLDSPGHAAGTLITSIADLGAFNAGDTIRLQFIAASDGNTAGTVPNWEIDSVGSPSLEFWLGSPDTTVTFSAGATSTNDSGANPPLAYQWFRNNGAGFVLIPGANSPNYAFVPQPSDNGAQFRVTASIPGASATSTTATLTVGAARPQINMARQANGQLVISWTGPSCLQETSTLNGAVIPWGTSTVVNGVPFTPAPGNKFYRLISCP